MNTTKQPTERGQALILIALAAIGLFGIAGLAIDGSAKFSDRRHAQNAADTAALAAALAKINGDAQWKLTALDRALENGYNNDLVQNTVDVYTCDEAGSDCGPYAGDPNFVKVVIVSEVKTYFSRLVGINQVPNTVEALAMSQQEYTGELYGGASIVGLADQCETIWLAGSAAIDIQGGGIFSNSKQDCGVRIQGGKGFEIIMDSSVDMVATNYTTKGTPDLGDVAGGFHGNQDAYNYPPPAAMLPTYTCDWAYSSFPPSGVTTLSAGTYCVNGNFKLNANDTLSGAGVTIVMESGEIDWNGGAEINLSAPTSGDLAGLLIYAPMKNTSTMKFNGNGDSTLTGTIFMPAAQLVYNGTGNTNPSHVQIIAYTIQLTGSNATNVLYQDTDNWDSSLPAQVGLFH